KITGCHKLSQKQCNRLEKTGMDFCPDATCESKRIAAKTWDGEPTYLLLFRIPYHATRVVRTVNGKVYRRIGDSIKQLTPEQINELSIDKRERDHETEPVELSYPGDFDMGLVRKFIDNYRRVYHPEGMSDLRLLEHNRLGKVQEGKLKPNVACALLFAKDPISLFPGCMVRFLRYEGEEERTGEPALCTTCSRAQQSAAVLSTWCIMRGEEYNVVKSEFIEGPIPT